jgi:hypothetical protein
MTEQEARAWINKAVKLGFDRQSPINSSLSALRYECYSLRESLGQNVIVFGEIPIKRLIAHLIRFRVRVRTPTPDDGFNWLTGRQENEQ